MIKPVTQYCIECKTRKPIKRFSISRGICADCNAKVVTWKPKPRKKSRRRAESAPPSPKKWRCPNCWQRVLVTENGTALVDHVNLSQGPCRGSGHKLRKKSKDALDYRLPGNFEGGKRR